MLSRQASDHVERVGATDLQLTEHLRARIRRNLASLRETLLANDGLRHAAVDVCSCATRPIAPVSSCPGVCRRYAATPASGPCPTADSIPMKRP
jgi:hypothetical protein